MDNKQVILIVDDRPENLQTLGDMLEQQEYEVMLATSGADALKCVKASAPDLILLDILMPEMDGYELCRRLKADPDLKRIPVIFISALTLSEQKILAFLEGGVDYVTKPFQVEEVLARVQTHLKLTQIDDLKHEIAERKRVEAGLRTSEERYRAILQSAMDGFWLVDMEMRLLEVNEAYCRMSGYSEKELLAMRIADLESAETAEETAAHMEKITSYGEDRFESQHRHKDGSIFDVEVSVQFRPIDGGLCVCFLRDITGRKQAEQEKVKLETQLQQARKMETVGRLAGGVAHDFNNMLTVISGHAELALMGMDPNLPLHAHLVEISKTADRSADLTRQLLTFARKQTIAPKVLDLNEVVSGMLPMLQRLIGEDIHLVWQPGTVLWSVKMDPSQIDQILANLCVNARDAIAGGGEIIIKTENRIVDTEFCSVHGEILPGEYVLISVNDNGCGMDKEIVARIFEPYFTTKEMGKGTGLGLATVQGIAMQNNGAINIDSKPGEGTTFTIMLPRQEGASGQVRAGTGTEPVLRGNETILLVEDDATILDVATMMLEIQGYTVLAANSPGEALRMASEGSREINLLITDVVMPEMDGKELSRRILALHPQLRIVFMSGYTANVIAHHGVLDEGVHFIQKPFSLPVLAAKIREVLDDNR